MSSPKPRRERVERNIYLRPAGKRTDGSKRSATYEVGYKDGAGIQRWRSVPAGSGIMAARVLKDDLLARRGRGERVAPNVRLRFAEAADKWLDGPVRDLRASTQAGYRNAIERHLRPRFATRRLDTIEPDDVAEIVRDLRAAGKSEATIAVVLGVLGRVYKYAARRLAWAGANPVALLLASERPKLAQTKRRPIFEGESIEQTITAAREPWRTLFIVAALTGARVSELCALTWADVRLDDLDDAELEFGFQVDRQGRRAPTKTDGSARTIPVPRELAALIARHKLAATDTRPTAYVWATRTGRPFSQRNVQRALRAAQRRAVDGHDRPTYPVLHERDERGKRVPVPRGAVPSMHSFRHTVASRALLAGESVDEVAFMLGHRDGNVTRTVYVREVADARRRTMRRSRMTAEYGSAMEAAAAVIAPAGTTNTDQKVRPLRRSS